jgi:hypothetical protein
VWAATEEGPHLRFMSALRQPALSTGLLMSIHWTPRCARGWISVRVVVETLEQDTCYLFGYAPRCFTKGALRCRMVIRTHSNDEDTIAYSTHHFL